MIWNTPPQTLSNLAPKLKADHSLKRTRLIHTETDDPTYSIKYFEIPSRAHTIGRLVIPFVRLTSLGVLDDRLPAIYGVTSRPNAFTNESSEIRSREAHVSAEHHALTYGIFKDNARKTSEYNAAQLIPAAYRDEYIGDRVAHLDALVDEIQSTGNLTAGQRDKAALEISLAIKMFVGTPNS